MMLFRPQTPALLGLAYRSLGMLGVRISRCKRAGGVVYTGPGRGNSTQRLAYQKRERYMLRDQDRCPVVSW